MANGDTAEERRAAERHLNDVVLEAYRRGCRDTIVAIGQSLRILLDQSPPGDLEATLRKTEGLLAPEGER